MSLLEARRITKRFGGTPALQNVSFCVEPGEIHAICGENGAGKSTLIRILAGYYPWRSYEGELYWNGERIWLDSIRAAESVGMAVIHQELSLVRELSVAENLFLGRLPQKYGFVDWAATFSQAKEILKRFSVEIDPESLVSELGIAQQQLVEIARALARKPQLLILDEPTAALGRPEIEQLLDSLRRLQSEGVACIYISHKLDEVKSIADRITVLRDGQSITTQPAKEMSNSDIIQQMVGRPIEDIYPSRATVVRGSQLLQVDRLAAQSGFEQSIRLNNISFELKAGEILGIGGLMGAGRSELLLHLYGLWGERNEGSVTLLGKPYSRPTPNESLRRGLMLVTEDRKRFGLVHGQSTQHNVSLSSLSEIAKLGWIDSAAEHHRNAEVLSRTRFRALSDQIPVERLSGGNQQKVVIARGLLCEPKVILLDEPTRGVDVAARREIYEEVQSFANRGNAILWVSSELAELMGVCDRIAIMRNGKIAGVFQRSDCFDSSQLLACALGREPSELSHHDACK